MNNFEIINYKKDDLSMDIKVSTDDETAWLSLTDLTILFNKSKPTLSRHLKKILEDINNSVVVKNGSVVAKSETTGKDGKRYKTSFYNLDIVLLLGEKIKSDASLYLREFLKSYFNDSSNTKKENIIIYNNGNISIDVNVSPEEETVWLNQRQIAELFDTTRQNVALHINNIIEEGELEDSVSKKNLNTDRSSKKNLHVLPTTIKKNLRVLPYTKKVMHDIGDGRKYSVDFYNLDMILAIGYRVKSSRAIQFRRWATSILKDYLLKGYVLDEKRTLVTNDNYIHLINKVNNIDDRVTKIEKERTIDNEKIFFDGEYYDSRYFIESIIASVEDNIILIDPYSDLRTLGFFITKEPNIQIRLYTSSFAKLSQDDIDSFNCQYGKLTVFINDTFHDRFIIVDNRRMYHLGASLNYAGKKTFAITEMVDEEIIVKTIERVTNQSTLFSNS